MALVKGKKPAAAAPDNIDAVIQRAQERGITLSEDKNGNWTAFYLHADEEFTLDGTKPLEVLDDMEALIESLNRDDLYNVEYSEDLGRYLVYVNGVEKPFSHETLRGAFAQAKASVLKTKGPNDELEPKVESKPAPKPEPKPEPEILPPPPAKAKAAKPAPAPVPEPGIEANAAAAIPPAITDAIADLLGAVTNLVTIASRIILADVGEATLATARAKQGNGEIPELEPFTPPEEPQATPSAPARRSRASARK